MTAKIIQHARFTRNITCGCVIEVRGEKWFSSMPEDADHCERINRDSQQFIDVLNKGERK